MHSLTIKVRLFVGKVFMMIVITKFASETLLLIMRYALSDFGLKRRKVSSRTHYQLIVKHEKVHERSNASK